MSKILYSSMNKNVVAYGEFEENDTHFIQNTTYFDKGSCGVLEVDILPENMKVTDYIVENNELKKINESL